MSAFLTAREIGRLWFENVWNQRDKALARELMAEDAVGHLEGGREIVGSAGFLEFQATFLGALPDLHIEVVDTLADGDAVCVHWKARGKHTGAGFGLLPSGAEFSFRGVTWFRTHEGRIVDGWDFWNMDGLMGTMAAAAPVVI